MIEYVVEHNVDDRVLKRACAYLNQGGLVAYPTDSSWGIGASVLSKPGLERLKKLKGTLAFTPTLLCSGFSQWSDYAEVTNAVFKIAKKHLPGPYVFVLPTLGSAEKKWGLKRQEVGLRIPQHDVPRQLVEALGHPVFSLTASHQMSEPGWWDSAWAEEILFEYGGEVDEIPGIELVLDTGEPLPKVLTTVVDFTGGEPSLLRQGLGPWPFV